jgi:hypothetical protein
VSQEAWFGTWVLMAISRPPPTSISGQLRTEIREGSDSWGVLPRKKPISRPITIRIEISPKRSAAGPTAGVRQASARSEPAIPSTRV